MAQLQVGGQPLHDGKVSFQMMASSQIAQEEMALLRDTIWRMRHPKSPGREPLWPQHVEPIVKQLVPNPDPRRPKEVPEVHAIQRIYEWESDTTWFRAYEVEVLKFEGFKYVLDFTNTTNHEIQGTFGVHQQRVEANLQPFELETICLVSRNKLDPFKFAVRMQWEKTEVHPAILETAFAMNTQYIRNQYEMELQAGIPADREIPVSEIEKCLAPRGLRYVDTNWYPKAEALYIDGEDSNKYAKDSIMWRRAGDFCADPTIFKVSDEAKRRGVSTRDIDDAIEPQDIRQGKLGDCWFVCSLASMSERPELIRRIFMNRWQLSPIGVFEILFWHNGIEKTVILDDYFPCEAYSGPVYSKTGEDELWVAVIEKAYAQLYGCYERIVSGTPYHALTDLTGYPTELIDLDEIFIEPTIAEIDEGALTSKGKKKELWEKLLAWNKSEENLMCAACEDTVRADPTEDGVGLMLDHSYTILDARVGQDSKSYPPLLQIRNPWGHGEWKGEWSDNDSQWTNAAKRAYGLDPNEPFDRDDGLFWMKYDDFLMYFTSIAVCFARKDWQDARVPVVLEFDEESESLTTRGVSLHIPNGGEAHWLSLYQQDDREETAVSYTDLALFIFEDRGNGNRKAIGFVGMETARQVHCDLTKHNLRLGPGNYLLVPFTSGRLWDPESNHLRQIGISCHCIGSKPEMRVLQNKYYKNEIDQVILESVMTLGKVKHWNNLERRSLRVGQMDLYCGRNNTQNKVLIFSMKMSGEEAQKKQSNIVNACGYPDLSDGCQFDMMPGQCAIFGVQVMADPKKEASSAYSFGLKSRNYGN